MPVAKLTCPECSAVLKPAKPVPEGKKIKCPKCGTIFEARAEDNEPQPVKPAARPKPVPAAKKPSSPVTAQKKSAAPAKSKPAAPAKPKPAYEEDDDDAGTYAV